MKPMPPATPSDTPSFVDPLLSLLNGLPCRTLFQNEFVSLVLVGLKSGQELLLCPAPVLLLTVGRGRVLLRGMDRLATLNEGGQRRLEQGDHWEISALSESDLLLFIPRIQ
jgi:hypothetical protein